MERSILAIACATLLVTACRAPVGDPVAAGTIPRCDEVPRISAPADWYGDSPIYVANEQPTDQIRAWAVRQPGFEELWIDRDHLGWVAVAFSEDAEARQVDLEKLFPGVGVVAVPVDWTMAELEDLQRRVQEELAPIFPVGSGTLVMQGVVSIGVGVLSAERIAAVEERFAGERVCVEGRNPEDVPAAGPQQRGGDGWRLLADEQGAGQPYRTGIASDQASYEELWADIGLPGQAPAVDFVAEVVIWFGAVYGSSCPNLRLDGVVIDLERRLVHAAIVNVDVAFACTADANPHAYLVAVQRNKLPSGPFAIQLGADDPPAGAPEERTLVDIDLSQPGAVAGPDDVHGDPSLPEPVIFESGTLIEPGFPVPYRFFVHCGIEWLGFVNDIAWRTEVPEPNFVPAAWLSAMDAERYVEVSIVLLTGPEPWIEATANSHTVIYRPVAEEPPGCD